MHKSAHQGGSLTLKYPHFLGGESKKAIDEQSNKQPDWTGLVEHDPPLKKLLHLGRNMNLKSI